SLRQVSTMRLAQSVFVANAAYAQVQPWSTTATTEARTDMAAMSNEVIRNHAAFIWSVADLLRGDYKRSEYGRVILPMVVLRRLDCVLERTKAAVRERARQLAGQIDNVEPVLEKVARQRFYNTSPLDFHRLLDDPATIADQFRQYISEFSPSAREVIEKFAFDVHITRLAQANLLFLVVSKFAEIDLHP